MVGPLPAVEWSGRQMKSDVFVGRPRFSCGSGVASNLLRLPGEVRMCELECRRQVGLGLEGSRVIVVHSAISACLADAESIWANVQTLRLVSSRSLLALFGS